MTLSMAQRPQVIEWHAASRPAPGQSVSGDLHVVAPWSDGVVLGVIDGLGHGAEALAAARIAAVVLEQRAGDPVVTLVQHCHRALQRTRGVVMTVASLNSRDHTLTALGIGNVETLVRRADPRARPPQQSVLLRGGVVGYQLPALQPCEMTLARGDVLVFATDGVREDFSQLVDPAEAPHVIAEKILAQKFRGTDDGLVFACRYGGPS